MGRILPLIAVTSLIVVPWAGDPYQAPRAAFVAAVFFVVALGTSRRRSLGSKQLVAGASLLVLAVISMLLAGPESGIWGAHGRYQGILSLVVVLLAGLAGMSVSAKAVRGFIRVLIVVALVEAAVVAFQALLGRPPVGTFGNTVLAGSWFVVAFAVAAAAAVVERGRPRGLAVAAALASTVALGVVGSRGAWVGWFVAIVLLAVVVRFDWRRWGLIVAGIALIVASAALVGGESFQKLDPVSLMHGSAASRIEIWKGGLALIADNPLTGVGPGRLIHEYPAYETVTHAVIEPGDVRVDQLHSQALQFAAEVGILATLLAILLAAMAMTAGLRAARARDGFAIVAVAGLIAYLAQGVFGIATIETAVVGWFLGGVALARDARQERAPRPRVNGRDSAGRFLMIGIAAVVCVASAWYVVGDVAYNAGSAAFYDARFSEALTAYDRAVRHLPQVDIFRVAQADAASYLGGDSVSPTLTSLDVGLAMEPRSYDLLAAKARLLALYGDRSDAAEWYVRAADAYPRGVTIRAEALEILIETGRDAEAERLAREALEIDPDLEVALRVVGGDSQ